MDDAARRVLQAAMDARSDDDLVGDEMPSMLGEDPLESPLDEETLDERASTQMGELWESRRRDAD